MLGFSGSEYNGLMNTQYEQHSTSVLVWSHECKPLANWCKEQREVLMGYSGSSVWKASSSLPLLMHSLVNPSSPTASPDSWLGRIEQHKAGCIPSTAITFLSWQPSTSCLKHNVLIRLSPCSFSSRQSTPNSFRKEVNRKTPIFF